MSDGNAQRRGSTLVDPACKKCGGALQMGYRHKHERPGWTPRYDDFEGALEGYESEPIKARERSAR